MTPISLTGLGADLDLNTFRELFEAFIASGVDKDSAINFAVDLADGAVDWTKVFPNAVGVAIEGVVERLILKTAFALLWNAVERKIERLSKLDTGHKSTRDKLERLTEAGALAVERKRADLAARGK